MERRALLGRVALLAGAAAWSTPVLRSQPAAAAGSSPGTTTTTDPPSGPTAELLGTYPPASGQPTDWGRRIQDLMVFDGIVFIGYGDWNANTGPVVAGGWDISAADFVTEATLDTENNWMHRIVAGRLIIPFIDPRAETADLAVRSAGSPDWTMLPIGPSGAGSIHAFDVTTFDGTDLWVAGSRRDSTVGAVWRSASGLGGDWVEVLTLVPPGTWYSRYVLLVVYEGRLYTLGRHSDGTAATNVPAQAWDGTSWTEAADFNFDGATSRFGFRPLLFDGTVVRRATWPYLFEGVPLLTYDGTSMTVGSELVLHHTVDAAGRLWWIDDTSAVWRRSPGGAAELVFDGPTGSSALAVHGSDVYVGTASSELWRVQGV